MLDCILIYTLINTRIISGQYKVIASLQKTWIKLYLINIDLQSLYEHFEVRVLAEFILNDGQIPLRFIKSIFICDFGVWNVMRARKMIASFSY